MPTIGTAQEGDFFQKSLCSAKKNLELHGVDPQQVALREEIV